MRKTGTLLPLLCLFGLSFCAIPLPDSREVVKTIRDSFTCRKNNPALSVAIVKDGSIIYANGFGVQSLNNKKPVTKDTLFGIASLTKAFTSALLAKLTDKNKLYSLNTPISEFYGNSPVFDGYFRSKVATVKDILSHRMGIPMHNFIRFDKELTRRNLIRRLKVLRPRGRFRDSFYYSNIMYGQAARIAEKIGRKKFEDLITEELFREIGMTNSDFFTTANSSQIELAQGYLDVYGELHPVPFELSKRWSDLCGANCILSSAVDMAKWLMFQLSKGKNQDGKRVMSEDALTDTHKPENPLTLSSISKYFTKPNVPETFSQSGYAMGWRTGHYRGYNMLTHTGSSWGYKNMITLFPDMDLGIYTAMTGDDEDFFYRYSLHQYLADMYLGETPWLNSTLICSFPEPWFPKKKQRTKPVINKDLKPKRDLDDYLGVYENPAYGRIEMFILDEESSTNTSNKLIAEFGYVDLILYPKKMKDEFYFETDGIAAMLINFGTVQFKETNGVIDKMRIPTLEPKDPPIFKRIQGPTIPTVSDPMLGNSTYDDILPHETPTERPKESSTRSTNSNVQAETKPKQRTRGKTQKSPDSSTVNEKIQSSRSVEKSAKKTLPTGTNDKIVKNEDIKPKPSKIESSQSEPSGISTDKTSPKTSKTSKQEVNPSRSESNAADSVPKPTSKSTKPVIKQEIKAKIQVPEGTSSSVTTRPVVDPTELPSTDSQSQSGTEEPTTADKPKENFIAPKSANKVRQRSRNP